MADSTLSPEIRDKIDNFRAARAHILEQLLSDSLSSDKINVHVGDGWFVEKTLTGALEFIDRSVIKLRSGGTGANDLARLRSGNTGPIISNSAANLVQSGSPENASSLSIRSDRTGSETTVSDSTTASSAYIPKPGDPGSATTLEASTPRSVSNSDPPSIPIPTALSESMPVTSFPAPAVSSVSAPEFSTIPALVGSLDYAGPETFQLMDIREELDDEDNIVTSTVRPHDDNEFTAIAEKELGKSHAAREQEIEAKRTTSYEYVEGKPVFGPEPPVQSKSDGRLNGAEPKGSKQNGLAPKSSPPPNSTTKTGAKTSKGKAPVRNSGTNGKKKSILKPTPPSSRITELGTNEPVSMAQKAAKSAVTGTPTSTSRPKGMLVSASEGPTTSAPVPSPISAAPVSAASPATSGPNRLATDDLLQLELIASEFDDEDMEDHEEWKEDEEDEEDEEHEDKYGRSAISYQKFDSEELERRARAAEQALEDVIGSKSTPPAGVRFSTEAGIKIFDKNRPPIDTQKTRERSGFTAAPADAPAQPNEPKKKVSRFKAARQGQPKQARSEVEVPPRGSTKGPVNDIVERAADEPKNGKGAGSNGPVSDIVERSAAPVSDVLERVAPKFDTKKHENGSKTSNGRDSGPKNSRARAAPDVSKFNARSNSPRVKTVNLTSLANDDQLFTPISQLGTSAASTSVAGVSSEVYDLAKEYFEDSMLTDDQFLAAHDIDEDVGQRDAQDEEGEEDDTNGEHDKMPIMSNISERAAQSSVIMRDGDAPDLSEISEEYQRLRNKLINSAGGYRRSEEEEAFEPVDEDGNPIKMSRFKAARLYNR